MHLLLRKQKDSEEKVDIAHAEGRPNQPGLTQIQGHTCRRGCKSFTPRDLRKSSPTCASWTWSRISCGSPLSRQTVLGDSGEHLPTVLRAICEDPRRKETLVEWMRELMPMDVRDFEFPTDPSGRVHLVFLEANGRKVSADAASDGTLRFLAMLAVLLGPDPDGLYFFEEIDNGIHPTRQWLLLELIEKQTAKQGIQVVTTTHSPDLLTVMNDDTFSNTSVVCRWRRRMTPSFVPSRSCPR